MKRLIKLAIIDFKLIFRDPSLRVFIVLPVLLFALIIWAVPALVERYAFLEPYIPLMIVVAVIENTQMFSFISTMVLIDEKETEVAKNYAVVPLSKAEYIISRFIIPYLFTFLLNVVLFVVQPFFSISIGVNIALSAITALVVPAYALGVNSIVTNRMQGMVYVKAFNMIVLLPIAAFFVPDKFEHLFGFLPTHWIYQSIERVCLDMSATLFMTVGTLFFALFIWWISKQFIKKHFV